MRPRLVMGVIAGQPTVDLNLGQALWDETLIIIATTFRT